MRLTVFSKLVITLIILGVVGFVGYDKYKDKITVWAVGEKKNVVKAIENIVDKTDFNNLSQIAGDAKRNEVASGIKEGSVKAGKLTRPLVVGINTWAGHAPGVVFNRGLEPNERSLYKKDFGMDVKFILLEDPAAKFAAFKKGDIDIMWDTVDNWAREASLLAETGLKAKSIILQDWSRGGDGIVALSSIKSVEDLKGKRIACTQFTPSHFLLLFLLNQSGLTPPEKADIESKIIFTQDAPAAAAMFKAKQVDAAVTWEPDLSGAVTARGEEAHLLVTTSAATNVIADTLVARGDIIESAPETVRDFVYGWLKGIETMKADPSAANAIVGEALKLDADTISGMLSGLKLTAYADNAIFYGLSTGKSHFQTLFDTAFIIWRKKGLVTRAVNATDYVETAFLVSLAAKYGDQKVVEKEIAAKAPSIKDRAIINKNIQVHFTPGSDTIMDGSFFVLDSLGETMIAFGNTYLRIEGNTDSMGNAVANLSLSERRSIAVKNYLLKEFPQIQPARFQTIGHGEKNPVAPNTTEAGRQLNRRTDIKVILSAD